MNKLKDIKGYILEGGLWFRILIFLTFHIKFKCLFIFNQLQQLLKCACADQLTNKRTKGCWSAEFAAGCASLFNVWQMTAITFIRQGQNLLWILWTFFFLTYLLQINNQRFEHNFLSIPRMIHARNMMPLVHSRFRF